MKILTVHIKNFRSIVDSDVVDIDPKVTVFIGKNEKGKTTLLKALESFNFEYNYSSEDLPKHLNPSLERKNKSEIEIINIEFYIDGDSLDYITKNFHIDTEKVYEKLRITKYYNNQYGYELIDQTGNTYLVEKKKIELSGHIEKINAEIDKLKEELKKHTDRLPSFIEELPIAQGHLDRFLKEKKETLENLENSSQTTMTILKGLPNQDAAIQEGIEDVNRNITERILIAKKEMEQDSFLLFHKKHVPSFIFHSNSIHKIPDFILVDDFLKNPDKYKGMGNLCKVAGLSNEKIKELTSEHCSERETFEDHYEKTISGNINEFWTQKEYTIHFRFDRNKLSISIKDNEYDNRIPLSSRSDGFRWLLSFYSSYLVEISSPNPKVLLLDNPALELHSDGQRDVKKFLEEQLPGKKQIFYVTHSSAMVNPLCLEQVRIVGLTKDKGTKISSKIIMGDADNDLLEPVRSALGVSLMDSMLFDEYTILCEGSADRPIMEGTVSLLKEVFQGKKIIINGGLSEKGEFLINLFLRSKLPFIVLVDGDSSGCEIEKLAKKLEVGESKIINLKSLKENLGIDHDVELESLMSKEDYYDACKDAYPKYDFSIKDIDESNRKITNKFKKLFGDKFKIGFDKRRVAENLKSRIIEKKLRKTSLLNLEKLAKIINNAFNP